jgi:hypothetical protein
VKVAILVGHCRNRQTFARRVEDLCTNIINIRSHAVILESNDLEAQPLQDSRPLCVCVAFAMLDAVHFDDEPCLKADEVPDESPNRMLPPESKSADLSLAQSPPQRALRIYRLAAHRPCRGAKKGGDVLMRHGRKNKPAST